MRFLYKLISITCVVSCLCLTQCTKLTGQSNSPALNSPFTLPADAYLALAKNKVGDEQQSLLILAVGRLVEEGQWQQALHVVSQINSTTQELNNEKSILLAKIEMMRQHPSAAITQLSHVQNATTLTVYYQAQFHELLALAYQSTHNYQEAIRERIKLNKILPDATARTNNRRALWLSLTKIPLADLYAWSAELHNKSTLSGWVQLAIVARTPTSVPNEILIHLQQWKDTYPNHPANELLPTPLNNITANLVTPPKHIALLLPLTGPLSGPGNAVRDGFMEAYDASQTSSIVKVHTYDTNDANIQNLYQKALDAGADFIIGPLSKSDVAAVASLNHPVHTLLLNDLPINLKDRAYAFGLSPRNEARQVAARARKEGHRRALIIAPDGDWGTDVVKAFAQQWQGSGGHITDMLRYKNTDDLNTSIRNFLHVSNSEIREKQLQQILGENLESATSRRQDFDMIFLLAYPTQARQIMPLLKYYYAGDIPVYATSSVYSGNASTMKDRDLDGIIFCDMPWVFSHNLNNRNWPEQFNSYNRLYALGMDSYALTNQLNQLLLFPALGIQDRSGILYLNSNHEISRILTFGQFKHGLVEMIT